MSAVPSRLTEVDAGNQLDSFAPGQSQIRRGFIAVEFMMILMLLRLTTRGRVLTIAITTAAKRPRRVRTVRPRTSLFPFSQVQPARRRPASRRSMLLLILLLMILVTA